MERADVSAVQVGEKIEIIGHLARANPHWKQLPQGKTTVIFHGPHAYITPEWYVDSDVPTWSYSVVQVSK